MADYKSMYIKMFKAFTIAEEYLQAATDIMKTAQMECEELFIDADEPPISLIKRDGET